MKNPYEFSSDLRFIVNLAPEGGGFHTDQRELGISDSNLYTTHPPEIYNIETQIDGFFWKVPPTKYYGYACFLVSMLNFKGL